MSDEEKKDYKLFHYTSINTLYGILENNELWLCNTAGMNDKLEIRDFIDKLYKALEDELTHEIGIQEKREKFFNKIYKRLENEYPYAMCFSKEKDDAAQWERYADNAKGVCIVFNENKLSTIFEGSHVLLTEVFYDYDISVHKHYDNILNYLKSNQLEGFDDENGLIDNILACGYCHKHSTFKSEQEVRIATLWNYIPKHSRYDNECVKNQNKKVVKFDLKEACQEHNLKLDDLIDQIIIGPRSKQSVHDLKEYIKEKGFEKLSEKIAQSECPLR
jgi:hypothetical protein